eukprot:gene10743-2832_t
MWLLPPILNLCSADALDALDAGVPTVDAAVPALDALDAGVLVVAPAVDPTVAVAVSPVVAD